MKIVLRLKNGKNEHYKNIWEVQSNLSNKTKEVCLVGYDHIICAKIPKEEIEHIHVEFED